MYVCVSMQSDDSFLRFYGGLNKKSLVDILRLNEDHIETECEQEIQLIKHSSYYDHVAFFDLTKTHFQKFSISSTKIESINAQSS